MTREFKFYPEDFGKLTVKVLHFDLDFDVYDDYVDVSSKMKIRTLEEINFLELNAQDLEIKQVSCDSVSLKFEYDKDNDKLKITFSEKIPEGKELVITTQSVCKPTNNILEGLYYDETPEGAPPQIISQCQQWGFQRIVPCIDDMTAKATYITTITANSKYTNIISNGDLVEEKDLGNGRKLVKYDNTITPMAPYLFFLGCGTYATFKKKLIYSTGKDFIIELLVPPNSKQEEAEKALQIIHDAVQWIHIFTGPEKYQDEEKRKKLWDLIIKRDKENSEDFDFEIEELSKGLVLGYEYTGTVYREIGMQNSNFGGMENVGNTTITTNRIMPFQDMADGSLEYMFMVKVHEFYHNINGSEVTGWSPFEIWLNEAVTVHIERENSAFLFGEEYHRLEEIHTLLTPGSGTLAMDDSPTSMPVEPDGFNHPDELITGITYVKAPEFVKMIETLMGKEKFVLGLHNYHSKYAHSNATRKQWLEEMELAAKMDFQDMAKTWLKKTGFPKVNVTTKYENNIYEINVEQKNGRWEFPLRVAICNEEGEVIAEKTERISERKQTILFENANDVAFVSLNRGYSFYGKLNYDTSEKELWLQARKDKDLVARYLAISKIFNKEKLLLLENPEKIIDEKIVDLYYELLSDKKLIEYVGNTILPNLEGVDEEKYAHWYEELYIVRNKLKNAISKKYYEQIKELYNYYSNVKIEGSFTEKSAKEIKLRQAKNVCLSLLAMNDSEETRTIIKEQYENAKKSSERITAIKLYLESAAPDKKEMYEEFQNYSEKNLVAWELFLHIIASLDSIENIQTLKEIEQGKKFRIEQTNDSRALYMIFAMNKHISLCTDEGRNFLEESLIKLSKVNEYITTNTIKFFGNIDSMKEKHRIPLIKLIVTLMGAVKEGGVYNNCKRILEANNESVKAYEAENGKINFL